MNLLDINLSNNKMSLLEIKKFLDEKQIYYIKFKLQDNVMKIKVKIIPKLKTNIKSK